MKWYFKLIIFFVLLLLFFGSANWVAMHSYPEGVTHYQDLMRTFNIQKSKDRFLEEYPEVKGMNYTQLLDWLSYRLHYPKNDTEEKVWKDKFNTEGRPEDPIQILKSPFKINGRALGRCGEFSLVYTQLLLINKYDCRMMMGWHSKGDHVWIEVYAPEYQINPDYRGQGNEALYLPKYFWLTIDPTDSCAFREYHPDDPWKNCSKISTSKFLWGEKVWFSVYRISLEKIEKVTKEYNEE